MIVVVADDLSGAAELANAALARGLSADVQLEFDAGSHADVVCVSTESRSLPPKEALARVRRIAALLLATAPKAVFKKCDSLLRGHVVAEARAAADALARSRIVIAAANPSRGRLIRDGRYYIDGIAIAESIVAADPEYPRTSSRVAALLGDVLGVEIPDVESGADVERIASGVDASALAVGGVDFFSALLRRWMPGLPKSTPAGSPTARSALLVCGSKASWATRAIECRQRNIPVFVAPLEADLRWAEVTGAALRRARFACIGIGEATSPIPPAALVRVIARQAHAVLGLAPVDRVMLEGGATAAAVVAELGLTQFCTVPSPGNGVGALMPTSGVRTTYLIKPGSYSWPDAAWHLAP